MSYANRYVAMCDILGFRNFIQMSDLRSAVEQFTYLRSRAIERSTSTRIYTLDQQGYRCNIETIPSVVFSDTLLMWVDVSEENHLAIHAIHNFFDGVWALLAYSAECGLPFRVGVSYGNCYMDPECNTYIGMPIVNAYLTEQNQQWFGGACDSTCSNAPYFESVIMRNNLVIPYEIPTKQEQPRLTHAIEWVSWAEPNFDDYLRNQISRNSPEISIKYRNAMNFYSVVRPPHNLL